MLSVTSDVNASATYQNAPPKPALPDPTQLASSFSDLVDSNLPADPASTAPPAPEPAAPPSPPSRASNAPVPDNNAPRNGQSADQPPPSRSDSSSNSAPPAADDGTTKVAPSDAPSKSGGKSGTTKSADGKSTDKPSADTTSKADNANDQLKPAETPTVAQDPIAALIPVVTTPTNPQAPAANANAPLAIAAAAIAATSSTTAATVPPLLATATPAPKGTTGTIAAAKTTTAAATIGAATAQQASTDPTVAVDAAIVTTAGSPGVTTTKTVTGLKTPQATQSKAAPAASAGAATGTAVASASATTAASDANGAKAAPPQPSADTKPDQANTLGGAVKADANASAPSTAAPSAHDPAAAGANVQAPSAVNDPNAQLAALPQQVSPTAVANPADKLTVTQATGAAVPISGLAVEIAASAQSGKTHFDVRLDPADLGRIDVRIAVDRNGQVTSHLTVEKAETLSMLQQDAPQLQQALNDAGLKTGSGGLQFSLRDQSSQSGQNNFNQSGGQPQRLVISEDDTVPAAVAGRSYGRMLGANGGVDIRV